MKTKITLLLVSSLFAFGLSASNSEDSATFDRNDEPVMNDEYNNELVLSEENADALFGLGKLADLITGVAGKAVDVLTATKDWVKAGIKSVADLVGLGFKKAASVAEELKITPFLKEIPEKVLKAGESELIAYLLELAKKAGTVAVDVAGNLILTGLSNATISALSGVL